MPLKNCWTSGTGTWFRHSPRAVCSADDRFNPSDPLGVVTMTNLFQTVRNGGSTMSFILARNGEDARQVCVDAGQVTCAVDVEKCKDVTALALQQSHKPETLKALLD